MSSNEIMLKWVATLRSGEYKQTRGVLHDANGYCCLGVLCDLYRKEVGGEWVADDKGIFFKTNSPQINNELGAYVLPYSVYAWAGLTHGDETSVVGLNDDELKDFAYIANYIQEYLITKPEPVAAWYL